MRTTINTNGFEHSELMLKLNCEATVTTEMCMYGKGHVTKGGTDQECAILMVK